MADLLFKCIKCSTHLVVDGSASGETLRCLTCGQPVQVPRPANVFKCPSCSYDLSAPSSIVGKWFHCPNCEGLLAVPTIPTTRLSVNRNGDWTTSSGVLAD